MTYKEFEKFVLDGKIELELPIGQMNNNPVYSGITGKYEKTNDSEDLEDRQVLDKNGWRIDEKA